MPDPAAFWNDRYADAEFAYGTKPNDFLASVADGLQGPVLCLASGEGRNAVWLAEQGLEVHAVDASAEGVAKTRALAAERGVTVHAEVGDLSTWDLGTARWGAIVAIFVHLPPPIRRRVHGAIPQALVPGGRLILEAYTPRQLLHRTGGPPAIELLYEPGAVRAELAGLEWFQLDEVERAVVEGRFHTGRAAVVQAFGRRPLGA